MQDSDVRTATGLKRERKIIKKMNNPSLAIQAFGPLVTDSSIPDGTFQMISP
jgi:hypothetical protein